MSTKQKVMDAFHRAWNTTSENVKKGCVFISQKAHQIYQSQQVQTGFEKSKSFYENHKQACIGVGIGIVALYLLTRKRKNKNITQKQPNIETQKIQQQIQQPVSKQQKKKVVTAIPPSNKIFMDEQGVEFFVDQPSTDIIRKQGSSKKKPKMNSSSSDEDNKNDRLFFQMMETYRKTEGDQE